MRRFKRIFASCLAAAMIVTSICVPTFADTGEQDNYDMNGDGVLDAVDINGDGVVDYIDADGDGIAETPVTDTDGDGIPDTNALLADTNGDGLPDPHAGHVDTTGDGILDSIADGPEIGSGAGVENPTFPIFGPGPVVQQLPIPQESVNLANYTLTNSLGYALAYSVDNGITWSAGTKANPVDISSTRYSLAPGGTLSVMYQAEDGSLSSDSQIQDINIGQATKPNGIYATDPTSVGGNGTINGVDATMEYADALLLGAPYKPISGSSVEVQPGSYYVRVASAGNQFYSEAVQVTVNPFKSQKEPMPNAVFDAASMVLSNMSVNMEYCFDGVTWTHIADGSPTSKTLSGEDAANALAHGIQIVKKGNGSTTTDSDVQTIVIHKANTPNHVQGVAPTDTGNSGKIINVDTSMQYKLNSAASWIDIGSNAVTNLAPGSYQVRVRATGLTIASDSVGVNIGAYHPTVLPKEHTPGADFNAQIMVLSDILGTKYSLDGGSNWTYAKDYDHVQLHDGQVNKEKGIKIVRPGNGSTTSDSDVQTISISKANPPSGISAVSASPTLPGAINGLQSNMEYGPKGGTWTAVTATSVALPAGVYYVRTRGAYTTLPSDPVEVDINAMAAPVPVTPLKPIPAPTPTATVNTNTNKTTDADKQKEDAKPTDELTQEELTEKIQEAEEAQEATKEEAMVPAADEPSLVENGGVAGWTAIEQSVTADPVVVKMNGSTEVPAAVLQAVKAAGSELVIGMSDNIVWTIPGSAISSDVTDVNLGVVEDTNSIPEEAIATVAANGTVAKQFEVEYEGPLGFRATLTMMVDKANAGKYANLFCYKGTGQPMEFIDSCEIDTTGSTSFGMTHASSYVIVVSDEKYSEATVNGSEDVKVKSNQKEDKALWMLLIILVLSIVIIAVGVTVVMKKRQQALRDRKKHQQHKK